MGMIDDGWQLDGLRVDGWRPTIVLAPGRVAEDVLGVRIKRAKRAAPVPIGRRRFAGCSSSKVRTRRKKEQKKNFQSIVRGPRAKLSSKLSCIQICWE